MSDNHALYAGWAAAYTLGALDAEDRHAFERHLASCSECSSDVAAFAPLPGLIAKVEPADINTSPPVRAAAIGAAAIQELSTMRRRTRHWKATALVASAAAAVIAVVLMVSNGDNPAGTKPGPAEVAATVTSSQTDTAEIATIAKAWGTEIRVEFTGLPTRDSYEMWAIDTDGGWSSVATWVATPDGTARLVGSTATATDELARIVVTSDDLADVLVDAET